jgi:hypothetical protein
MCGSRTVFVCGGSGAFPEEVVAGEAPQRILHEAHAAVVRNGGRDHRPVELLDVHHIGSREQVAASGAAADHEVIGAERPQDRQTLGIVAPLVQEEFKLDNAQLGLLFSAFYITVVRLACRLRDHRRHLNLVDRGVAVVVPAHQHPASRTSG